MVRDWGPGTGDLCACVWNTSLNSLHGIHAGARTYPESSDSQSEDLTSVQESFDNDERYDGERTDLSHGASGPSFRLPVYLAYRTDL